MIYSAELEIFAFAAKLKCHAIQFSDQFTGQYNGRNFYKTEKPLIFRLKILMAYIYSKFGSYAP